MADKIAPKRASQFAPGIGKSLTELLGQDVVVAKTSISERSYAGEPTICVIVTLENGEIYHAWSASLANKIAEIPEGEYPLTFKFIRVPTSKAGMSAITFE